MEATEPKSDIDRIVQSLGQKSSEAEATEAPETTEVEEVEEPIEAQEIAEEQEVAPETEDEPEPEEPEEEQESEAQLYTVTVDGEEQQRTLEELIQGFSGQAYVQKGMKANAEKAKENEALQQELNAKLAEVTTFAQQAQATGLMPAPQEPNPELYADDPIGYIDDLRKFNQDNAKYQHQQKQLNEAISMVRAQHIYAQQAALAEKFPEMKTEEGRKAMGERMAKGAQEYYGLGPEVMNNVTDAFAVEVLNDAIKWRELQRETPKVEEKTKAARPLLKPKAQPKPDGAKVKQDKLRAKARKTGSIDDIAALIGSKG